MATFRNKRKLAALNKENCEEQPRRNFAENSTVPRSIEDYITQVFEEIEERVLKRLSQKFSRTKNRILGTLSRLDDFVLNTLIQGHSGTAPKTSLNVFGTNQGTNEDNSQSNFHPEADIFHNQTTRNSGKEECHDMVTRAHEKVTFCSSSTCSGKQKKNQSTSQRQLWSENTTATIEADQMFWSFSSWQITTILQISKTISTEFPNCQSRSRQQCPSSKENLRSSSCLKNFSQWASKFIISWRKMTESTTSILLCVTNIQKH